MNDTDVPDAIDRYQEAHDHGDTEAALATFEPDAVVVDDGTTHEGTEQIGDWLRRSSAEYTYTRTLTRADDLGEGAYLVHNHLSGNFPGGEVDLHYRFEIHNDRIRRLVIAP